MRASLSFFLYFKAIGLWKTERFGPSQMQEQTILVSLELERYSLTFAEI